ncbi:MAG TPA: outer membrane protein assembly factor BamA [Gemmataceae bacterium]|jgi:outer membrane protein assembly complex protein YaeT
MQVMERFLLPAARCAAVVFGLLLGGRNALAQLAPAPGKSLISDVIISGNQRMSKEQIKVRLRTQPGHEYNPYTVDEDVRELYKTQQFSKIETALLPDGNERVKVYFTVREMPNMVQKVTFLGNKHIKPDDLKNLTGVRESMPLNPNLNRQGCQKILEKYAEQGRSFADCQLIKGGDLADTEVVYQITEGPKVKVIGIQFEGNHFVTAARLNTQVKSSRQWFGFIGGTYNRQMVDADVNELCNYYRSFGFQDVRISKEEQRSADGSEVTLIFHIQEGPRYRIQDVPDVHGSTQIPREQLITLSSFKPGEYLDQAKVKRDTKVLTDYLGASGLDARVEAIPVWISDVPGVCNVRYEVVERPPARVGQVFIIGNDRTRDNVILRQVPLFPGQVLTFPDLDIAKANLSRLNIFTNGQDGPAPEVNVLDREGDAEFKDVEIKVNEANTGSLIFGLGVNSNTGLVGSIVLNERNFDLFNPPTSLQDFLNGRVWRGAGQNLRITAMPGSIMQMYNLSFIEPFLFDTRNSLHEDMYFRMMFFNEYEEQRTGNRLTLGRQLNRFWNVAIGTRVENVHVGSLPTGDPVDYTSVEGNNFQIGFPLTVTRDSRDSLIRPTQGSQLQLSYEELTGKFTFGVFNMLLNQFFTTFHRPDGSGRQVLVYRGQFGVASAQTPVYERFFAGGFTTIRGFQWRGVGPNQNGFFTGGDMLLLNSLEYQVPVTANDQIFLVGFVDSGTVSPRINEFSNYAVSAGFGIRFTVPMLGPVPIALDFGFPIVKPAGDITQVFNFWMGFSR